MAEYYTIITDVGKAKIANAYSTGNTVEITEMAAGDGDGSVYEPSSDQTNLKNEIWRADINEIKTDEENDNWIVVDAVIPSDQGGWYVREVGIFDEDGDMIAVGKYPETYKPELEEGTIGELLLRMIIEVSNAEVVELQIDPTAVLATRSYVDDEIDTHKADYANYQRKQRMGAM